ncbi:MAG: aminoacetone oxidase family FAD-binding enzyme [Eubacterium sp.]|nr:aminoacetone oxidase family FAD-binding enzyme [Eubacterium sp.]
MDRKVYDICIIGGGAAGLACAAEAEKLVPGISVFIVEKNDILGRKILSTGNGRCNLSNKACPGHEGVLRFFDSIGVITRTDEAGRIYPYSEDARDVADALTDAVVSGGADVLTGAVCTACSFDESEQLYETQITAEQDGSEKKISILSKRVLLAAGGKAAPKLGTTGDGYRIARRFYHTVTRLAPALTAVETHEDLSSLSGVRAKVKISLISHGGSLFEENGEIQFTDYGISGICVFNMSRFLDIPEGRTLINGFDDYAVEIDFLPDTRDAGMLVRTRMKSCGEDQVDISVLRSIVKRPVAEMILEKTGGEPEMTAWLLKHFMVHPSGIRGWDHAEITRGGIPLTEIKMDRMESKYYPGLFFAGEIIDFDGPCGGFNLENAWETGLRAAYAIAGDSEKTKTE